jgi:hypothetical protein
MQGHFGFSFCRKRLVLLNEDQYLAGRSWMTSVTMHHVQSPVVSMLSSGSLATGICLSDCGNASTQSLGAIAIRHDGTEQNIVK